MNAVAESLPITTARVVPLTEAVELNPRPDRGSLPDDLAVSFVPMAAVEAATGRMDATAVRQFGEVKKGYTAFREGDVLFAKITPCMENGKIAVARGLRNGVGCGSTEFHVLRPKPGVDPQYVYHLVSSARFRAEAAHHMTGAVGQKRVPAAFLKQCEIPLPDLEEQRRIVAEIEKQLSRLDEAVANLKRVKANLRRQRAAILRTAVEGTLVGDERRTDWIDATIGEVGQLISGLTKNPKREALPRKLPYLRVANVYANELRLDQIEYIGVADQELDKLLVRQGDLLVVEGNGSPDQIGRVAMWDGSIENCVHQNHLIKVRFGSRVTPQWALTWLLSPGGRHEIEQVSSSTSGLHTLSTGKVARLPIPVPAVSEQRRIVAEVDRRLSIVREIEAEVDANLRRAEALRQAVLQRAFCGQLVEQPKPSEAAPTRSLIHGTLSLQQSARIALSAEIVHRQHAHWSFGQTKHQKVYYLAEHIARIHTLDVPYMRLQRGPANLVVLKANEAALERMAWYAERRRDGSRSHRYVALTHAGAHTPYLTSWLDDERLTLVRRVIEALREWDTDRCERVATVYAAWNDLLLWKKEPTSQAILHEVLTHWHEDKGKKHSVAQWHESIEWLKRQGWQPTGFGHPTRDGATGDLFEDEARY